MINYTTILSDFDDSGTLLKWLKKVEEALRDAGLDNVVAEPVTAGVFRLVFTFADGTTQTTNTIAVPPGQDGTDGADGVSVTGVSVSTTVVSPTETTAVFTFTLSDGNTISTSAITLPQAPSQSGSGNASLCGTSYVQFGTAPCRWVRVENCAYVTIDIQTFTSSAVYAIGLPDAIQGYKNIKQRGVWLGSTTGTYSPKLCETDLNAIQDGVFLFFTDGNLMRQNLPLGSAGVLQIVLEY